MCRVVKGQSGRRRLAFSIDWRRGSQQSVPKPGPRLAQRQILVRDRSSVAVSAAGKLHETFVARL